MSSARSAFGGMVRQLIEMGVIEINTEPLDALIERRLKEFWENTSCPRCGHQRLMTSEKRDRVRCRDCNFKPVYTYGTPFHEKHLSCGEVLLVKRRSVGENRLKIAVTAPDSVEFVPGNNALVAALWTGRILPEFLESPLDAGIERLGVDLDDAQPDQLSNHRAERRLSRRHIPKLWLAQCNYRVFP